MKRTLWVLGLIGLLTMTSAAQAGGYYRHHYGHRHHHHGGGHGALVVGALVGGLVLGHLLSRPPAPRYQAYAAAPRVYGPPPGLGDCQPTTGTAYYNGRLAQYGGTICYDAAGNGFVLTDSTYFMGYID